MAPVDLREESRNIALASHSQSRAADSGQQRQESAERGSSRGHAKNRSPRRRAGGGEQVDQRRRRTDHLGAENEHDDRTDQCINDDRAPQGEHDGAGDRARGIDDLFAHRRDAGVSGEREEQQPGALEHPVDRGIGQRGGRGGRGGRESEADRDREPEQRAHDEDAGDQGRACHTEAVHDGEEHDRRDGDGHLPSGRGRICGEGHGHGRAAGDLADHEAPPRDEAPPGTDLRAGVGVRATGDGVRCGELRRRGGVAVCDDGGDREGDEDAAPGDADRGSPHREDAGADHRAEADGDRIRESQATGEGHPVIVARDGERRVTRLPREPGPSPRRAG